MLDQLRTYLSPKAVECIEWLAYGGADIQFLADLIQECTDCIWDGSIWDVETAEPWEREFKAEFDALPSRHALIVLNLITSIFLDATEDQESIYPPSRKPVLSR